MAVPVTVAIEFAQNFAAQRLDSRQQIMLGYFLEAVAVERVLAVAESLFFHFISVRIFFSHLVWLENLDILPHKMILSRVSTSALLYCVPGFARVLSGFGVVFYVNAVYGNAVYKNLVKRSVGPLASRFDLPSVLSLPEFALKEFVGNQFLSMGHGAEEGIKSLTMEEASALLGLYQDFGGSSDVCRPNVGDELIEGPSPRARMRSKAATASAEEVKSKDDAESDDDEDDDEDDDQEEEEGEEEEEDLSGDDGGVELVFCAHTWKG
eukprot:Gb_26957 [translate_table: standard]